jgi:hypothetical protein
MSLHSTIDPKFLPNLPGFKPKAPQTGFKKSYFKLCDGQVFLKDEFVPQAAGGSLDGDEASLTSFAPSASQTISKARKQLALQNANVILTFAAYFEESVDGSNKPQVRQCNIFFFIEDGTVKIVEKPQMNSGVSQGTLVKRSILYKPDGNPYMEEDFRIGDSIRIYGRTYRYCTF